MPWTLRMTLYSFLIALVPYCYIGWRLTNALSLIFPQPAKLIRIIIIVFFLCLNLFPIISLLSFFTDSTRDLFINNHELTIGDYLIYFPFWLGIILMIELFPYFIATDVLQLSIKFFLKHLYEIWSKWLALFKVGLFVFFLVYVAMRSYLDTNTIKTITHDLQIKKIPESLKDLSLLFIADLQVDRYTQEAKINRFMNQVRQNKSDIVLFSGDLITRGTDYIAQGLDVLCTIPSNTERIACLGDHDFWADAAAISQGLKNCGWTFLDNEHHIIPYKGAKILITGVTYIYSKRISSEQLQRLLNSAPSADLKILLVHQPAEIILRAAEQCGYHIVLAGHTHGGQVVFKPFGFNLTPTQFENTFYSGVGKLHNLNIVVTNGIGLSLIPLRYQAPAEIMKINIKKE